MFAAAFNRPAIRRRRLISRSLKIIGFFGAARDQRIRLAAQRSARPADLLISVRDDGPGVAADIAAHLFEPLTTSKRDGLGLGLSICGSIVAAHGGRIWLQESGTDGTEFGMTLPFKSGEPA